MFNLDRVEAGVKGFFEHVRKESGRLARNARASRAGASVAGQDAPATAAGTAALLPRQNDFRTHFHRPALPRLYHEPRRRRTLFGGAPEILPFAQVKLC